MVTKYTEWIRTKMISSLYRAVAMDTRTWIVITLIDVRFTVCTHPARSTRAPVTGNEILCVGVHIYTELERL